MRGVIRLSFDGVVSLLQYTRSQTYTLTCAPPTCVQAGDLTFLLLVPEQPIYFFKCVVDAAATTIELDFDISTGWEGGHLFRAGDIVQAIESGTDRRTIKAGLASLISVFACACPIRCVQFAQRVPTSSNCMRVSFLC